MASQLASTLSTFRTTLLSHQESEPQAVTVTDGVIALDKLLKAFHTVSNTVQSDEIMQRKIASVTFVSNFREDLPSYVLDALQAALSLTIKTVNIFLNAIEQVKVLSVEQSPSQTSFPVAMLQIFADIISAHNIDRITTESSQEVINASNKATDVHTMILHHYFTNEDVIGRVFADVDMKI